MRLRRLHIKDREGDTAPLSRWGFERLQALHGFVGASGWPPVRPGMVALVVFNYADDPPPEGFVVTIINEPIPARLN